MAFRGASTALACPKGGGQGAAACPTSNAARRGGEICLNGGRVGCAQAMCGDGGEATSSSAPARGPSPGGGSGGGAGGVSGAGGGSGGDGGAGGGSGSSASAAGIACSGDAGAAAAGVAAIVAAEPTDPTPATAGGSPWGRRPCVGAGMAP